MAKINRRPVGGGAEVAMAEAAVKANRFWGVFAGSVCGFEREGGPNFATKCLMQNIVFFFGGGEEKLKKMFEGCDIMT